MKTDCSKCNRSFLKKTAEKTNGLCMSCYKDAGDMSFGVFIDSLELGMNLIIFCLAGFFFSTLTYTVLANLHFLIGTIGAIIVFIPAGLTAVFIMWLKRMGFSLLDLFSILRWIF